MLCTQLQWVTFTEAHLLELDSCTTCTALCRTPGGVDSSRYLREGKRDEEKYEREEENKMVKKVEKETEESRTGVNNGRKT